MKNAMLLLLAVAVVLGFSSMAVYANEKTGVVKSVNVEGKTLVVTAARDLTFTVTDKTKILLGDKEKTLADIKAGDKVTVVYDNAGETRTATKITILPVPEKKAE
jgi:Cu/Ag efflux protein CusF